MERKEWTGMKMVRMKDELDERWGEREIDLKHHLTRNFFLFAISDSLGFLWFG